MARSRSFNWFSTALLTLVISKAVFACSLPAGAKDPTSENIEVGFMYFGAAIIALLAHGLVFFYRGRRNAWIFWTTIVLSLPFLPLSAFFALVNGGGSCGEGTIEVGRFVLWIYLGSLGIQLLSWIIYRKPVNLSIDS